MVLSKATALLAPIEVIMVDTLPPPFDVVGCSISSNSAGLNFLFFGCSLGCHVDNELAVAVDALLQPAPSIDVCELCALSALLAGVGVVVTIECNDSVLAVDCKEARLGAADVGADEMVSMAQRGSDASELLRLIVGWRDDRVVVDTSTTGDG